MKKLSCLWSFPTILMICLSLLTFGAMASPVQVADYIDAAFPASVPLARHQSEVLSPEPVLGLFESGHGLYKTVGAAVAVIDLKSDTDDPAA